MKLLYDSIAKVFGENDKSRKVYKIIQCLIATCFFLSIIIDLLLKGIKYYKLSEITTALGYAISCLILLFGYAFITLYIIKNKYDKLHVFPDISKVDFKGGKLKVIKPYGETIFKVEYDNCYGIIVKYTDNEYKVFIENPEWLSEKVLSAHTAKELEPKLIEAVEYVADKNKK